ncbi:hypothetical protein CLAFUW4_14645 [Fulvia fulva]|uniref:Uncharacterized protein n=1 Tax=Passalora fulva TaxID=5499 RepID=A0A9Q8PM39_PASFU|nr:uncharacterized protein CLAFUR5_14473 [Fulvia fulva]KAK4609372.1 hypothetical protein CLAFUR4_14639 [Fulvia fulva]KAK4609548.1 hypothetical protein CLAFUR0_14638 [Fulvia fulva]UJO24943.1 hypothetical protein CLAFUR5_14473 [Fulvia fulva]WPV22679.1 hypothetical protein CLAFUW4_14645 [Fulvia fulva]WPV37770.1 hypothetical protein CLAFUW7_14648 [Fulvia fulva]
MLDSIIRLMSDYEEEKQAEGVTRIRLAKRTVRENLYITTLYFEYRFIAFLKILKKKFNLKD